MCKYRILKMIQSSYVRPDEVIVTISEYNKTVITKFNYKAIDFIYYYRKGKYNQASNRNVGIKHAKCKYISFFDSDDYMSKCRLKIIYNILKKYKNVDFVLHSFSNSVKFLYNENTNYYNLKDLAYNYTPKEIYNSYYLHQDIKINKMWCCRFLGRKLKIHNAWLTGKSYILKRNLYNESKKYFRVEDTELNYRLIMKKYNYLLLKYNLGIYIPHSNCESNLTS